MNTKINSRAYFRTQQVALAYGHSFDRVKYNVHILPADRMLPKAKNGFVVITIDKVEAIRKKAMKQWLARDERRSCSACRYGRCHVHHPRHARRNHSLWGF